MAIVSTASIFTVNDKKQNLKTFSEYIKKATEQKAELIVFPELALQGLTPSMLLFDPEHAHYQYDNAEVVPEGESTQYLIKEAQKYNMYICWGMTEMDAEHQDVLYNSAVLVGPEGYIGTQRKVHNPLTERLYVHPGNDYHVFDTKIGKIGMMVCFDLAYPEVARILALKGAEIILTPTGWPAPDKNDDDLQLFLYNTFSFARASENMIFLITSTLAGEYNGCNCAGHSRIIGPMPHDVRGETGFEEGLAVADINVTKDIQSARIDAMMGTNLLKDRRPDTYHEITRITDNHFMNGKILQEM